MVHNPNSLGNYNLTFQKEFLSLKPTVESKSTFSAWLPASFWRSDLVTGEASAPVGQVQNAAVCDGEQFLGEETPLTPQIG